MGAADKPLKPAADGKIAANYWNTEAASGEGDYEYWTGDNNGPKVQDTVAKAVLDAVLAKLSADPSTATAQAALKALFDAGTAKVQVSGSLLELRGLAANKPVAPTVVGTTYWSVDTDPNMDALEAWNGAAWVVMV